MKISGSYTFNSDRKKVCAAITDPDVLHKCIDGCEKMVMTKKDQYDVHLKLGVAGLKGRYIGKIRMTDKKLPDSYTLLVEGKGMPGFVKGKSLITMEEKGKKTELTCDADVQVGGLIAAIGSRLISAVSKKMMASFFKALAAEIKKRK
ncbi:MAG: carbon monoxide dehydrogenase subunit G [Candidatus Binatia bacterium]|jgi:carbon monoxide dehydrogenase subunit G